MGSRWSQVIRIEDPERPAGIAEARASVTESPMDANPNAFRMMIGGCTEFSFRPSLCKLTKITAAFQCPLSESRSTALPQAAFHDRPGSDKLPAKEEPFLSSRLRPKTSRNLKSARGLPRE